jgi:imidazolonepropionase-like amidohydrolase
MEILMSRRIAVAATFSLLVSAGILTPAHRLVHAQTAPVAGIRENTPRVHAFTNARIVQGPAKVIQRGTMVVRDGIITSVGTKEAPPDARVWDLNGLTLYPGLIDGFSEYGMPRTAGRDTLGPASRGPSDWNPLVLPQQDAAQMFLPDPKTAAQLRAAGMTTVLSVPIYGIFRGTSALINLGDGPPNRQILRPRVAQHIRLTTSGTDQYPNSLMGAIALVRQTLLDAGWYRSAREACAKDPALPRPEANAALAALEEALRGKLPVVIEGADNQDGFRAMAIAKEFSLDLMIAGSGYEYQRLETYRAAKKPILLPVNFPSAPYVRTPEEALQVSLAELRYWDEAPESPSRLVAAGVPIALTSATLREPSTLLARARQAVARGLSPDDALAALTTTPSRLFAAEKMVGTLEPGRTANFLITDGPLFENRTVIREVWIDGNRYPIQSVLESDPRGVWSGRIAGGGDSLRLSLKGAADTLTGSLTIGREIKLSAASLSAGRLALVADADSIGKPGVLRMSAAVGRDRLDGTGEWPDGASFSWSAARVSRHQPEAPADTAAGMPASFAPVYPPGEFGRTALPEQPDAVLVRGATIWTSGPDGIIENGDLLIQKGKVAGVGRSLSAPAGAAIIDGRGKHVTPGLIDPHSHMAVDGAVNEGTQAISSEVRIGDVIDGDDIAIYRCLAGGLTSTLVLHGSANPIGGQSQVIKLRWGVTPDQLKFAEAPSTIKFALGENVKQSNWGDRFVTRYPQSRMGVEQILRDAFQAAHDYRDARSRYEKEKSGIPPRTDLELEALVEILEGKRLIHCHSYRQDEILAVMRIAENFGFRIAVFTHILEGYKVADVMARHGVAGSTFSDWWAYKLEVYDAIPYNGALMHEQGVLTTFNSDSDELARRLNLEGAKAVKYGNVSEEEALRFMTINGAKQLRVDRLVGSLEEGKDADFVIWSGHPLSTYTSCEQTWVDGRRYFDREEDRTMQAEVQRQRNALIQKALRTPKRPDSQPPKPPPSSKYSCKEVGR